MPGIFPPMPHRPFSLFSRLALLAAFAVFLGGCAASDPYSKRYTSVDINPNPAILNSAIIKGTDLSNLRLQNVVVKDATFFNTTSRGAVFKNVVFDNCRFINASFDRAVMENVLFKGGILTCEDDPSNTSRRTRFTNSRFVNTILDGAYLENAVFTGADGSIAFRNCLQILAAAPLVSGTNLHLTLERSYFRRMTIAEITGNSTLTAANCRFEFSDFGNSSFAKTVFAKNIVYGPPPYEQGKRAARPRR